MDNFTSLIIGIVSSLIATAVFISVSELIRRVAMPWYEDKIYRGVRIDGEWRLCSMEKKPVNSEGEKLISKFVLTQKGERITGDYMHTDEHGKPELYSVTGIIRDGYLSAIMAPKSRRALDGVVALFHIRYVDGRLKLFGASLYVGDPGQVLIQQEMIYELKNA